MNQAEYQRATTSAEQDRLRATPCARCGHTYRNHLTDPWRTGERPCIYGRGRFLHPDKVQPKLDLGDVA